MDKEKLWRLALDLSATNLIRDGGSYCLPHGNYNCTGCSNSDDYMETEADMPTQKSALEKILCEPKDTVLEVMLGMVNTPGVAQYAKSIFAHYGISLQDLENMKESAEKIMARKIQTLMSYCQENQ